MSLSTQPYTTDEYRIYDDAHNAHWHCIAIRVTCTKWSEPKKDIAEVVAFHNRSHTPKATSQAIFHRKRKKRVAELTKPHAISHWSKWTVWNRIVWIWRHHHCVQRWRYGISCIISLDAHTSIIIVIIFDDIGRDVIWFCMLRDMIHYSTFIQSILFLFPRFNRRERVAVGRGGGYGEEDGTISLVQSGYMLICWIN